MATRRYRRKSAKGTRKSMRKLKKKTTTKRGGSKGYSNARYYESTGAAPTRTGPISR